MGAEGGGSGDDITQHPLPLQGGNRSHGSEMSSPTRGSGDGKRTGGKGGERGRGEREKRRKRGG